MRDSSYQGANKATICHMTSAHRHDDIRIFRKQCVFLAKAGFRVVLIAPHVSGKELDSVHIVAVPLPRSRTERLFWTTARIFFAALKQRAALYHFHDPELIGVGLLLRLLGKTVVYDVHEDYGKTFNADEREYINSSLLGIARVAVNLLERLADKKMSGIVTVTRSIAQNFTNRNTVVVQNYPIVDEFFDGHSTEEHPKTRNGGIYIGGLSVKRGAKEIVAALGLMEQDPRARILFAGTFVPPTLQTLLKEQRGSEKLEYRGLKSRAEMADLLRTTQFGVVTFHPAPNHLEAQPNKLFEYMSAGLPVIASNFPLWREIVEGDACGLVVDPLSPEEIASAMRWLLDHADEAEAMGKRGRKAVREKYSWDAEFSKLLGLYRRLLGEHETEGVSSHAPDSRQPTISALQ